jgi:hypothetical protein
MVAVREYELGRTLSSLEPLEALAWRHRINDDASELEVVRVDRQPDPRVNGRPVVDAWEQLSDGTVRRELECERAQELRPRRRAELGSVAAGVDDASDERHPETVREAARTMKHRRR